MHSIGHNHPQPITSIFCCKLMAMQRGDGCMGDHLLLLLLPLSLVVQIVLNTCAFPDHTSLCYQTVHRAGGGGGGLGRAVPRSRHIGCVVSHGAAVVSCCFVLCYVVLCVTTK